MRNDVVKHAFKPSVAQAKLRDNLQTAYPEDNAEILKTLPSSKAVKQTFSNKRKLSRTENFDPLAPPAKIFVSF